MSNQQNVPIATNSIGPADVGTPVSPTKPAIPTTPTRPTAPLIPSVPVKPVLLKNTIGVRELKNNLTKIVNIVRNEQKEYVVTVHGQPVAVLRPYTEEDAVQSSDEAFEQEMAETLALAKRVGDASRKNGLTGVNILEQMREESACR